MGFSTHTGSVKTPLTNSSRLSVLTQHTKPLEETQELTGSALKSTTKESLEVLLLPVRSTEVSDKRVTEPPTEDHQSEEPGREETLKSSEEVEDSERIYLKFNEYCLHNLLNL